MILYKRSALSPALTKKYGPEEARFKCHTGQDRPWHKACTGDKGLLGFFFLSINYPDHALIYSSHLQPSIQIASFPRLSGGLGQKLAGEFRDFGS
jgi:hypothetical protein